MERWGSDARSVDRPLTGEVEAVSAGDEDVAAEPLARLHRQERPISFAAA
jgi:hypothetical protein